MSGKKLIFIASLVALVLVLGALIYVGKNRLKNNDVPDIAGISIGSASAPVQMEQYTNFLCPACAVFAQNALLQIEEEYVKPGKVKMVFYILPPIETAKAGYCAEQGGKFMEFHDYIFANQADIKEENDIFEFAKNVGLDSTGFLSCYKSSQAQQTIESWVERSQEQDVTHTPTFFINGQRMEGALPYEEFKKVIDEKLK